ncbi:MAG TPA: DUF6701 domain-containing protein [Rhodocyclaceae bacterium]
MTIDGFWRVAALCLAALVPQLAVAASCTSNATGNWNTAATWNCGHVPVDGDSVTIQSGHTITQNATTHILSSLTISGTLTQSGTSGFDVCLGGNLINNGTIDFQASSGTNTIFLAGSSVTSTWSGGGSWLLDNADINGSNGTCGSSCSGTCKIELSGSPYLKFINSSLFSGNSATATFNAGNNATATLEMNRAGNQTVTNDFVTFPNLVLSGSGTKTPTNGTLVVKGSLTVNSGVTLDLNNNDPVTTISGSFSNVGTTSLSNSNAFIVSGALSNSGTLIGNGGAASVGGNFSNSGTFTSGSGTWTFNGSGSSQSFSGAVTFQNLTLNNSSGFSLGNDITASTLLTMSSGKVATGANSLVASASCPGGITGSSSAYVIGNLKLTIPSTNPVTCTFHVGDATAYTPLSITKTGSNSGTLSGTTAAGDHADTTAGTNGINAGLSVNRTWTLTSGTLSASTPYSTILNFVAGDIDAGATTSNFVVGLKSGGTWSLPTVGTKTGTSTQATGLTAVGVFAVGEGRANCSSTATGNWNTAGTWTSCRGGVPLAGDTATINNGHTVTLNVTTPAIASLTVNSGGVLTASAANTLTLAGNLVNNGSITLGTSGSVTLTAASQWSGAPTAWTLNNLDLGNKALSFSGSAAISINGSVTVGSGSINSGGANTSATLNFSGASAQTVPTAGVVYPNLTLSGAATKTSASGTLDVRGNFTVSSGATFSGSNNPTVSLVGNFSNSGGFSSGSGTWTLVGSSAQTLTGATTFNNLAINNANGVTLASGNVTIATLLTLTNGVLTTGSNILITTANCTVPAISRGSGFVAGNLRLTFPSGTQTCTYHVGTGSTYAPIGLTLVSSGGTLTGSTTAGDHPDTAAGTSNIDGTKSVNRYWTLWASGDTIASVSSYGATFNFAAGDLDASATVSNFKLGSKTGGAWTLSTPSSTSSTSVSISGVTGGLAATIEFAAGERALTCWSDDFSGTPPLSSNWSVGHVTGSFGDPAIVSGRLRLTDATASAATHAALMRLFPAAGNKIVVEFDHYAYNNSSGADGIALILSDASQPPVAGAFGGSMGYAQKGQSPISDCTTSGGCPGFRGGWLGVAIDEYGNFSFNSEGRSGGSAPGRTIDSVSLRGSWGCSASPTASCMTGYAYMTGTGTLSPGIDAGSATNHRYRVTVDHSNGVNAWTTVERDTSGAGTTYTTLLGPFDAKAVSGQAAVPTNWYLSFTGSTGAVTNIHEIDNLKVCSTTLQTISLDHIRIEHDGSAQTCTPESITIKACANTACDALYLGSVTVDLSNIGTWSVDPVTFSGGSTTVTLTESAAATYTLGGTVTSTPAPATGSTCYNTAAGSTSCSITFSGCGSGFDAVESGANPSTPLYTKLAGTSFAIDVLATSGGGSAVATGYTGAVTMQLVDGGTGGGVCGSMAALTPVTITPASPYTFVASDAGRKSVTFSYAKAAANVYVRMSDGINTSCSKDNFTIRPQQFALTASPTGSGNALLAGTQATGASVIAITANAGVAAGYVTIAGAASVNTGLVADWQVSSVAINAGSLTGSFGAAAGSSASGNFYYSDFGTITFTPDAVTDSSFTSVDQNISANGITRTALDCNNGSSNSTSNTLANGRYGCYIGSAQLGPMGRFHPDHYEVAASFTAACNGFTYMGQPLLGISYSLYAVNSAGDRMRRTLAGAPGLPTIDVVGDNAGTQVLVGNLSSCTPSLSTGSPQVVDSSATPTAPVCGWPAADTGTSSPFTLTGTAPYTFLKTTPVLYDSFALKTIVTDSNDVRITSPGGAVNSGHTSTITSASTKLRYGRLRLMNAYGSELLPLLVPVRAEYFNGSGWSQNTLDNCSNPGTAAVAGSGVALTVSSFPALSGGTSSIKFNAPGVTGLADIALSLGASGNDASCNGSHGGSGANLPWLQYAWCAGKSDPNARVKFGAAKQPFIYLRERY